MEYIIYTDGGYSRSSDVGAYAYVVLQSEKVITTFAKKVERSTNNRCELLAIIKGVESLPKGSSVLVKSDSQYCIGVLSGKFNRKKNLDLIEEYLHRIKENGLKVKFEWVKGHNGYIYNEMCDTLCNEVAGCDLNGL